MMGLDDRLASFILGCIVGGTFGIIIGYLRGIKADVNQLVETNHHDESGLARMNFVERIALFVVVLLVAYSAIAVQMNNNSIEQNYKDDEIARCKAGVDVRNIQRATVDAIYNLATGVAKRNPNDTPLTEDQIDRMNAYINQVNDFRQSMYDQIKPSDKCAPYVDDDHVEPPTAPFPTMKDPNDER